MSGKFPILSVLALAWAALLLSMIVPEMRRDTELFVVNDVLWSYRPPLRGWEAAMWLSLALAPVLAVATAWRRRRT